MYLVPIIYLLSVINYLTFTGMMRTVDKARNNCYIAVNSCSVIKFIKLMWLITLVYVYLSILVFSLYVFVGIFKMRYGLYENQKFKVVNI